MGVETPSIVWLSFVSFTPICVAALRNAVFFAGLPWMNDVTGRPVSGSDSVVKDWYVPSTASSMPRAAMTTESSGTT